MFESVFYQDIQANPTRVGLSEDEMNTPAIGVSLSKEEFPRPDDLTHPDNFNEFYISLPAAKALMVDLRNSIEALEKGEV